MGNTLQGSRVLVVGRDSGIARALTLLARAEGAEVHMTAVSIAHRRSRKRREIAVAARIDESLSP